MQKPASRMREITFRSEKNRRLISVHTENQRKYAEILESDENVKAYDACVPLKAEDYIHVNITGLRKQYFQLPWTTDFLLTLADNSLAVRELATPRELDKQASLEQLEFSRRYWEQQRVDDWKIVLVSNR